MGIFLKNAQNNCLCNFGEMKIKTWHGTVSLHCDIIRGDVISITRITSALIENELIHLFLQPHFNPNTSITTIFRTLEVLDLLCPQQQY